MNALLDKQVSKKSYLMTDDSNIYPKIGKKFRDHESVNHSIEEYVRGDAHVNNAENYFSIPSAASSACIITSRTNICRCTLPSSISATMLVPGLA
jgi:hypothetical protein